MLFLRALIGSWRIDYFADGISRGDADRGRYTAVYPDPRALGTRCTWAFQMLNFATPGRLSKFVDTSWISTCAPPPL